MTSLFSRTAILSLSRVANQAIVLVSPMLLVRILSVSEYGGYREFMLYVGLAGPLITLGIPHSLAYFLPKYPERERIWVTQTALYILASSIAAIAIIGFASSAIRANTSFDFVFALQLYLLFFTNLDFIEYYWLGKKRTDYVFFYSSGRLLARIVVVVSAAYITRDAYSIVLSLVVLEAVRCLIVLAYAIYQKWFTSGLTRASHALQASYFLPLGGGAIVEVLNRNAGMLFVSTMVGPEALAFYVIGSFVSQIVNIFRGAIADVIFPEIVELKNARRKEALPLWQQATVWYCILIFPLATLMSLYADVAVTVLFTAEYAPAIPVFSTFALLLVLDCFDFHLPLRVQNANRYFMIGSVFSLVLNVILLYPMYIAFSLIGPVIAFILSRLLFTVYVGYQAMKIYGVSLSEIVYWRTVGRVMVASILCAPILVAGKYLLDSYFLRGLAFGLIYVFSYFLIIRFLGVFDFFSLIASLFRSKMKSDGVG